MFILYMSAESTLLFKCQPTLNTLVMSVGRVLGHVVIIFRLLSESFSCMSENNVILETRQITTALKTLT